MSLDPLLLEILVDPEDKQSLWYFADEGFLYNPRLGRRFAVDDGIPIMLIEEAVAVDAEEQARLAARQGEAVVTAPGATR